MMRGRENSLRLYDTGQDLLTSFLFYATLEEMDGLNQRIPQHTFLPSYRSKHRMFIILLLVAMFSGISGYLIGVRTEKGAHSQSVMLQIPTPSMPQVTLQPSPAITSAYQYMITPIPTTV